MCAAAIQQNLNAYMYTRSHARVHAHMYMHTQSMPGIGHSDLAILSEPIICSFYILMLDQCMLHCGGVMILQPGK